MFSKSFFTVAVSLIALSARADFSPGVLTVTEPLKVVWTIGSSPADASDKRSMTLAPGTYRAEMLFGYYFDSGLCLTGVFCDGREVDYTRLTIYDASGKVPKLSVSFKADGQDMKGSKSKGQSFSASKMRQSFNMFLKVAETTENANVRVERNHYCDIPIYTNSGGGGLFSDGGGTTSAIGHNTAHLHDVVVKNVRNVKFTNKANQAIASFADSHQFALKRVIHTIVHQNFEAEFDS